MTTAASTIAQKTTLTQAVADMRVGDRRLMDYPILKSTLTSLRALQDGRRWSLALDSTNPEGTTYYLVRKA